MHPDQPGCPTDASRPRLPRTGGRALTRRRPILSWLYGRIPCLAAALAGGVCIAPHSPAAARDGATLQDHFTTLEARLLARGHLRDQPPARGYATVQDLLRDFDRIALGREYGTRGGLMRWEVPVAVDIAFGASVPEARRAGVRAHVADYVRRLSARSGHPVRLGSAAPNFTVFVVSEGERHGLGPHIAARAPGMADRTRGMLVNMGADTLCMVAAVPHADRRQGYAAAVAVIRAELPDRLTAACIEEEIAQGLGLPNDGHEGTPSLFNDGKTWARLTACDEQLLALLYDRRLRSGMSRSEALAAAEAIVGGAASARR
ncbi:MAG: DUF2927 domain-containing protein [Rhodobacteraceae bacterium]|nr:DUF2927 domain-containing protein [Paracoccaceae bacterium]